MSREPAAPSHRNLASARGAPNLSAAMTPHQIEREIEAIHQRLQGLEDEIVRLSLAKISRKAAAAVIQQMIEQRASQRSILVRFRKGDWEQGPMSRAWLVEQLVKERQSRRTMQKFINKITKRLEALERITDQPINGSTGNALP